MRETGHLKARALLAENRDCHDGQDTAVRWAIYRVLH